MIAADLATAGSVENVLDTAAAAMRAARVHCPIDWPDGPRCLNCRAAFPCPGRQWAAGVLLEAGWSDTHVAALDRRTGCWS